MSGDPFHIWLIHTKEEVVEVVQNQIDKLDSECELTTITDKKKLTDKLTHSVPDVVISVYHTINFSWKEIFEEIKKFNPSIPFIILSNQKGEEIATDSILQGASDYVLKDRPERLKKALKREISSCRSKNGEKKLSSSGNRFESLVQTIDGIVWEADAHSLTFLYVSPQTKQILGYSPSEWYENSTFWQDHIHPEDREEAIKLCRTKVKARENHTFEYRMLDAEKQEVWIRDYITIISDNGEATRLRGIMIDVTNQKRMEAELDKVVVKLKERIKEQDCLYRISKIDEEKLSIPQILQTALNHLPDGFQYPEITDAAIEFNTERYQTENFKESENLLIVSNNTSNNKTLTIKVSYREEKPIFGIGSFLKEEKNLLDSVAETLLLKVEHVLTRNEIKEKNELLEKAYTLAEIGNWELNLETSKMSWSSTTKSIHEVPQSFEPTLKNIEVFYEKSGALNSFKELNEQAIKKGESFDTTVKINTAQNNERWIRVVGEPEYNKGRCTRVYGSIQNIDKRKRAEEDLQKSEQRLKALVQEGLDLITIVDEEGKYKYIAPTSQRLEEMGMEPEKYIGESVFKMFHEGDVKPFIEALKNLKPNESVEIGPVRYKRKKDGEWRWMKSSITNLTENPAIEGYVTNSQDITERIERERKLKNIVEYSTNLFYQYTADFELTYVSPGSKVFLGCSPEEVEERWTEFSTDHPVNDLAYKKSLKAIETGEAQEPFEMQLQKLNGEKMWVEVNEAPIIEDGKTVGIVGSLTDITEQKEYKEKLEQLSIVAAKTTDFIYTVDAENRITWVNKSFEESMGYSLEDSMGKTPVELMRGPETDKEVAKRITNAKKNRSSIQEVLLNYKKMEKKYGLI